MQRGNGRERSAGPCRLNSGQLVITEPYLQVQFIGSYLKFFFLLLQQPFQIRNPTSCFRYINAAVKLSPRFLLYQKPNSIQNLREQKFSSENDLLILKKQISKGRDSSYSKSKKSHSSHLIHFMLYPFLIIIVEIQF